MGPFTRILVDIDASVPSHPALERAIRLAQASGASLTITDVTTVPAYARRYLPPGVEEEMVERRRQQLSRIARGITAVPTEGRMLFGRPATVLIQEVLRSGHDLLMRSHARETTTPGPRPFGAVDLELLRKCPCPVFLVRHGSPDPHPQIVAAVNASTEEPSEQALNQKIVELTLALAQLEGGVPTLLQAWAPFGERMVRSHASDEAFAAYVEDVRSRTAGDLKQLAQAFDARRGGIRTVHRRGQPEEVLPEFVVAEAIDVVVMGTVARTGIAGLFIGNTAERVLRKLPCSVLAIKPDGFVSPVTLDSR